MGILRCFRQLRKSYKDRTSRTPWHFVPHDVDFALAKHVKPLTDALAFRGRSPRVTKRATHPRVPCVKTHWQCFYKGFNVPSAYSGKRLRSSIFLAPSCATGQDLRSCVKTTLAVLRRSRSTGNWPLATGNCPSGHKKAATSGEVTASGFTFGAASLRGDATTPRAVQEDGDTSLNSSLAYSAVAASQVKEVG